MNDLTINQRIEILLNELDENKDTLESLYVLTHKTIFKLAFSILNNIHDAEDVMQDTFVNVYKYAHLYNSHDKPLAWMFTITKNLCYAKLKKSNRNIQTSIDEIDKFMKQQDNAYDKLLLKNILGMLNEEERRIVLLSSSGFKHREIAKLLDLKLTTVLSKYHRAMKKIRNDYKEV